MKKKICLGIQARSNSKRFPKKIYQVLYKDKSVLENIYGTCQMVCGEGEKAIVEAYILGVEQDQELKEYCATKNLSSVFIDCAEDDLLTRFIRFAEKVNCDGVVRITSDCPLIPKEIIENVIHGLFDSDYVTNVSPRTFPDGWDCQACWRPVLEWLDTQQISREHVFWNLDEDQHIQGMFIKEGFRMHRIINSSQAIMNPYHPDNKISIDTPEDLLRVQAFIKKWEEDGKSNAKK